MPGRNSRGPIASTYSELQALDLLLEARSACKLPRASPLSTARAILQCLEIGLLNVVDLLTRATTDLLGEQIGRACTKASWAWGFHRLIARLAHFPQELRITRGTFPPLAHEESPARRAFAAATGRFEEAFRQAFGPDCRQLRPFLASASLEQAETRLAKIVLSCDRAAATWGRWLIGLRLPAPDRPFEDFVSPHLLARAVREPSLEGDTFFTQFRGCHQIPEVLGAEVNDHLEEAVCRLRAGAVSCALEHLRSANTLFSVAIASVEILVENLTAADYHQIRENLGLTSGSHSVGLHYYLFGDLYEATAAAALDCVARAVPTPDPTHSLTVLDDARHADPQVWLAHDLFNECFKLRAGIAAWRENHLDLPRQNLGGSTRSLAGAQDAVQTVIRMRDTARIQDPLRECAAAAGLEVFPEELAREDSSSMLAGMAPVAEDLLRLMGEITRENFPDVQERIGLFAGRCPFLPPPRRIP